MHLVFAQLWKYKTLAYYVWNPIYNCVHSMCSMTKKVHIVHNDR